MSAASSPRRGTSTGGSDRHPAQWLALAVGIVYTLVGIAGFAVTGFDGFAEPDGDLLLGIFEVNPLHNIVHLLIGLAGLALWNRLDRARIYGWLLAVGYGAVFVYGLFVAETDDPANFLALNQADNWLHVGSALVGLVIALWPADAGTGRSTDARTTDTSTDDRTTGSRRTGDDPTRRGRS